jgi:hypothetical protein
MAEKDSFVLKSFERKAFGVGTPCTNADHRVRSQYDGKQTLLNVR